MKYNVLVGWVLVLTTFFGCDQSNLEPGHYRITKLTQYDFETVHLGRFKVQALQPYYLTVLIGDSPETLQLAEASETPGLYEARVVLYWDKVNPEDAEALLKWTCLLRNANEDKELGEVVPAPDGILDQFQIKVTAADYPLGDALNLGRVKGMPVVLTLSESLEHNLQEGAVP